MPFTTSNNILGISVVVAATRGGKGVVGPHVRANADMFGVGTCLT